MINQTNYVRNVNKLESRDQSLQRRQEVSQSGFADLLNQKILETQEIKFSKHAEIRLQERNIRLTQHQKDKIGNAVNKALQKGVKDSLILMDDLAMVVNVRSKTVITAAGSRDLQDNVFTNIDGAVII
jgi:flagellar operon protein